MAGKDYKFTVMADDLQPYGPVGKENLDIIRITYDMSCWLETSGNVEETIGAVIWPSVLAEPNLPVPPWQNDYPLDATSVTNPPPDDYPLAIVDVSIASLGKSVTVRIGAGTPGLTYVVSLVVSGGTTKRRKQLDCLVTIELPLNPGLVADVDVDPEAMTPPLIVTGTATIPLGYTGRVYVENGSGAPITITLPASPELLARISPVDLLNNFAAHPCTYTGAPGDLIEGQVNFLSNFNQDDLIFEWDGSQWIVLYDRYALPGRGGSIVGDLTVTGSITTPGNVTAAGIIATSGHITGVLSVDGTLNAGTLSAGTLNAANANISSTLTVPTINCTSTLSAPTVNATNLNAGGVTTTGTMNVGSTLTAPTGNFTNGTFGGTLTAATLNVTSTLTAPTVNGTNANFTGTLSVPTISSGLLTLSSQLNVPTINCSSTITAPTVNGTNGNFTGLLTTANLTVGSTITVPTVNCTSSLSAPTGNFTNVNVGNLLTVPKINCTSDATIPTINAVNINATGLITAAAYATSSDRSLKLPQSIGPIPYGMAEILQLNPVTFQRTNQPNPPIELGFIAQEVAPVLPEAVRQINDLTIEGLPPSILGLMNDALIAVIVNALKQVDTRLKALENA